MTPPSAKQVRVIWAALTGLAIAVLIGLLVALIWGLGRVIQVFSQVLWPIAAAGVIACLLDPVVDFLERRKVPRTRAVVVVFALAFLLVAGLAGSVIPQVVVETQQLETKVPAFTANLQQKITGWIEHPPAPLRGALESLLGKPKPLPAPPAGQADGDTNVPPPLPPTPARADGSLLSFVDQDTLSKATGWMGEVMKQIGAWLKTQLSKLTSLFGILAGLALIPIYAFYFLIEKRDISERWRDYLPVHDSKFKTELVFVLDSINEYLIAFFRGQVLVAICDGILYTIGFTIIGLPYSVLIGVMATFLTIIPFLGAIVTCVTALVISLVAFGDWQHPALVLVVVGIVQALEGTVIQPRIMGGRVGLHPLAIIIALMAGTTLLGGILGGILAIPLTAALRVVMFRYVWKKRENAP